MGTKSRYIDTLEKLKCSSNYRVFQNSETECIIDLSSNDYLGLLSDEEFNERFYEITNSNKYKLGSGSSRLLSGIRKNILI